MSKDKTEAAKTHAERAGTQAKNAAKNTLKAVKEGAEAAGEAAAEEVQETAERTDEVVHEVARAIDGKIALEFGIAVVLTIGAGALAVLKGQQLLQGRDIV